LVAAQPIVNASLPALEVRALGALKITQKTRDRAIRHGRQNITAAVATPTMIHKATIIFVL